MNKKHTDGTINQNHPDLEILAKNCECQNSVRKNVHSSKDQSYEGNYFRVDRLRYWNSSSIDELKNSFTKTNEQTSEYSFELVDVTDWEADDDRDWEACFTFLAHKK
jgi:hypothetical protein